MTPTPPCENWITFYNLLTGDKVPPQGCPDPTSTPWGGHSAGKQVSDLIVGDNAFFVAIGGTGQVTPQDQNLTYIDFFRIDYGTLEPPIIAMYCQANRLIENNTNDFTKAGNAHDIAMTPNGACVVVNHRNWIHIYNARGTLKAAFNVGNFALPVPPYSSVAPQQTDPLGAVDSIGIANSRAIVVTNRAFSTGTVTWVYLIDLLANPPTMVMDQIIGGSIVTDQHSHDVAVSPNGNNAMIASNGVVALVDLQANTLRLVAENPNLVRQYATLKDSVEMSDTRAVVISDSNESGFLRWKVQIYDTTDAGIGTVWEFESDTDQDRAHDLALTPNGTKVVVTSTQQNSIITGVNTSAPSLVPAFAVQGDPLGTLNFAFVSDSVVANDESGVVVRGGDHGGNQAVFAYFYHLNPIAQFEEILFDSQEAIYPSDLMLAPSGRVVLKLVKGPDVQNPVGGSGDDIVIYNFNQDPSIIARYEMSGRNRWCVDSLELTPFRILTVSVQETMSGPPPTGNGFVQITQY